MSDVRQTFSTASAASLDSPQAYIEETPIWRDGTDVDSSILTGMQWRIWWLACAGKFFEGMVVFMTGIALPLRRGQLAGAAPQWTSTAAVAMASSARSSFVSPLSPCPASASSLSARSCSSVSASSSSI